MCRIKKIKNAKKIAWFHSSANVFQKRGFINNIKYYDKVVVLTDDCKNDIQNLCPEYLNKIVRIYNPIDVQSVKNQAKGKFPPMGKYFCCVARMSYDKDIRTIIDAFDSFYRFYKDVKLVFVGGGDKLSEFQKYAIGLKSGKNIVFVGAQKNPYVYMANAAANILSSYGEGLPTVLVESQVVGTVNIASDCKYGPHEILMDGAAGLLFTPGNALQLAKCMIDVYENNIDVKKMIRESNKGLARFDKDTVIKQIISLIS